MLSDKMAQQEKALATKPDYRNLIPETYIERGENRFPQAVL